jgi:hypothetical protein
MIDRASEPGSWSRAIARGCIPSAVDFTPDRHDDPQQGSAQGEGDGAGESGFVQHHGSALHDAAQQ